MSAITSDTRLDWRNAQSGGHLLLGAVRGCWECSWLLGMKRGVVSRQDADRCDKAATSEDLRIHDLSVSLDAWP